MALFDTSLKNFMSSFKSADWKSEAERKEAVAAVKASGKVPYRNMIQIIQSLHPSEASKDRVYSRMSCLEELMKDVKEPSIVHPLLDLLGQIDGYSREFLVRILSNSYQKDMSNAYIDRFKSDKKAVREAIRDILRKVGGRTAYSMLKERIESNGFSYYKEVADVLCEIAGHHSIELLQRIIKTGRMEDRLHGLELLANARYMKLRKRKALEAAFDRAKPVH